jgi:hypothetical protein
MVNASRHWLRRQLRGLAYDEQIIARLRSGVQRRLQQRLNMVSSQVTEPKTPQKPNTPPKKEPPFPAALKLITGRRQTEWTGATRCPNKDNLSYNRESLIGRKRAILFSIRLPYRPLADIGLKTQLLD